MSEPPAEHPAEPAPRAGAKRPNAPAWQQPELAWLLAALGVSQSLPRPTSRPGLIRRLEAPLEVYWLARFCLGV